jgi:hypothetical protein
MDITGFLQARNYRTGGNLPINRVVIHDMEHPEVPGTAKNVAAWFAGPTAPQASAHYNLDSLEIWGSVHEEDTAWHAPPNQHSIGLEHAGFAAQTVADWSDPYSEAMLRLSARLTADLCKRHSLPAVFVPAADLLAGHRGITTHAEVSKAWHQTDHTDPGPNFPMAHYLNLVIEAMAPVPPATPSKEIEGVKITTGSVAVAALDDAGRGWVEVPCSLDRLMFLAAQGSAPARDGKYWPTVSCDVNDSGAVTVVTLTGAPHQATVIYYKILAEE